MSSRSCFVIAPIGEDKSPIRERSDVVFEHILEPVLTEQGYEALRADQMAVPGSITAQILEEITKADLVVADLTGHNPNVFYELALRHALNKPTVQIIAAGERIPFDVGQTRTIIFNHQDLRDVARCKDDLGKQIQALKKNPSVTGSPIATVLSALEIRASEDPLSNVNAEIMSKLSELTERFQGLEQVFDRTGGERFAEFIEGQDDAFSELTKVTKSARDTIRSSRFGPESVLGQSEYVSAIEQRVLGTDNRPPLKHYYRIVAVNSPSKQKDVIHHLNSFAGQPFMLSLTSHQNSFELVVVDETDVFIHFYKEEKVIASSLHLSGRRIAGEFIEIFDRLATRDLLARYDCSKMTVRGLPFAEVNEIFESEMKRLTLPSVERASYPVHADQK
jgi:hypothetical protein